MKNKLFIIVALALSLMAFLFFSRSQKVQEQKVADLAATSVDSDKFVKFHNVSFGNPTASVTVVEFFDPECEACRAIYPSVKRIIEDYKDRVRFVYRYLPFHANSVFAAAALEEAREHNKYEEALEALFEAQPEWGDHHAPRPELIPQILARVGVPKGRLEKDSLIEKHKAKIEEDRADALSLGARATPTFFVNGVKVTEFGEEPLRQAIEKALQK